MAEDVDCGEWCAAENGDTSDVLNPSGEVMATVPATAGGRQPLC